ncbi:MAG TPA: M6 family metalloprotease domain-containing protein [Candidatus Cloacimonadota bacterium]|nr:M6 family metalloprotease domain-containing protein [Candidatus Cloacimonadota bacterium]HPT72059.1 M6 family metalloprotease domain-containing protein [Candidatus Cloacimonadota bacterium]
MKRTLVAVVFLTIVFALAAYAPPYPKYNGKVKLPPSHSSEIFGGLHQQRNSNVPDSVLVLMVQFSDISLVSTPQYPDSLVHDHAFFDRYMLHLTDYYNDASHGLYQLQYTVHDPVITLSHPMSYYGVDDTTLAVTRQAEFARDIVNAVDADVDFRQYDGIVVFHAGAGQESDMDGSRTGELWSTFISRVDLQLGFDPLNDNYPGIATNDGKYVKEMVVVPEWEWQDYFLSEYPGFVLSTLGVLANQFGHLLGMPNLYDNDWSNGASEGVGNFCIMGSGAWNGNGYVPALPSAYERILMGWETPRVVSSDLQQISIDYLLSNNFDTDKVIKLPISEHEYFLLENREQNPDNSVLNGLPSFTFVLLQEGQAYYPQTDSTADPVPRFDFMTNRYKGCEWDFFLPGYGTTDPPVDGSGLLIWHVDENVIQANYRPNEGYDRINADAHHKGVDLEEASGIQDLDATNITNPNFRGGPDDSFREGNNNYFGQLEHNGIISQPTAESYYGGIPLEVSNISTAGLTMTFNAKFRWSLDAGYAGTNPLPASFIDFDRDGNEELFYPMPDGHLVFWKNDLEMNVSFPPMNPMSKMYAFDPEQGRIFLPYDLNNGQNIALYSFFMTSSSHYSALLVRADRKWAAGPILMNTNTLVLPLNRTDADSSEIIFQTTTSTDRSIVTIPGLIQSNIAFTNHQVFYIQKKDHALYLNRTNYTTHETASTLLAVSPDSIIHSIAVVPLSLVTGDTSKYDVLLFAGQGMYAYTQEGELLKGFPARIPFADYGLPSFEDIDHNGHLEILLGGENSFAIFGYDGSLLNYPMATLVNPDTLHAASGIWATDLNQDGKMELLGNMSKNRLCVWNVEGYPPYHIYDGFPASMSDRSLSYPLIGKDVDSVNTVYLFTASRTGKIFREKIDNTDISAMRSGWFCEYGSLARNAVYQYRVLPNQYATTRLFVPGEVYIYPNPWKQIFSDEIMFRVMTSRKSDVNVKIFDIAGKQLYAKKINCEAYLPNLQKVQLPVQKMASGVYLAVFEGNGETKTQKFAIEK